MTIPSITTEPLNPPPNPPTRDDPDNFRTRADLFVDWQADDFPDELNGFITELNSTITAMNTTSSEVDANATDAVNARDTALATANYEGEWSDLTGALNTPACVLHDDSYWMLVNNLADVTSSEPSDSNADWNLIFPAVTGTAIIIPKSSSHEGYLTMDGSTVLKSSYPRISDIDELAFISFTEATSSGTVLGTSAIYGVTYGNSKFVAVGATGKIAYSTDGDTWTAATDSGTVLGTSTIYSVAYDGTKFVCVGQSGKIAYSTDGDDWTAATDSETVFGSSIIYGVTYDGTKFVCVGQSGKIAYSTDGDDWTVATDSESVLGSTTISAVTYGNSKFVCTGYTGKIAYSTDGDNWTEATDSGSVIGSTAIIETLIHDGTQFICSNNNGPGQIAYSTDGDNWTEAVSAQDVFETSIMGLVSDGTRVLACIDMNRFGMSYDVHIWADYDPQISDATTIRDMAYGNSTFIAVGTSGKIFYGSVSTTHLYLPVFFENSLLQAAIKY